MSAKTCAPAPLGMEKDSGEIEDVSNLVQFVLVSCWVVFSTCVLPTIAEYSFSVAGGRGRIYALVVRRQQSNYATIAQRLDINCEALSMRFRSYVPVIFSD
jgi:hypothetical protein